MNPFEMHSPPLEASRAAPNAPADSNDGAANWTHPPIHDTRHHHQQLNDSSQPPASDARVYFSNPAPVNAVSAGAVKNPNNETRHAHSPAFSNPHRNKHPVAPVNGHVPSLLASRHCDPTTPTLPAVIMSGAPDLNQSASFVPLVPLAPSSASNDDRNRSVPPLQHFSTHVPLWQRKSSPQSTIQEPAQVIHSKGFICRTQQLSPQQSQVSRPKQPSNQQLSRQLDVVQETPPQAGFNLTGTQPVFQPHRQLMSSQEPPPIQKVQCQAQASSSRVHQHDKEEESIMQQMSQPTARPANDLTCWQQIQQEMQKYTCQPSNVPRQESNTLSTSPCTKSSEIDKRKESTKKSNVSESKNAGKKVVSSHCHQHHPDMPFLVTHWLSHYAKQNRGRSGTNAQALERILNAAAELASAFESLGAFGTSTHTTLPRLKMKKASNKRICRPATFSDMARKYASLVSVSSSSLSIPSPHPTSDHSCSSVTLLDSLVSASSSATTDAQRSVLETVMPWSLLEAAYEGTVPMAGVSSAFGVTFGDKGGGGKKGKAVARGAGRKLNERVEETSLEWILPTQHEGPGQAMYPPVLLGNTPVEGNNRANISASPTECASGPNAAPSGKIQLTLASNCEDVALRAASLSRKYHTLRDKLSLQESEIVSTTQALKSAMKRAGLCGAECAGAPIVPYASSTEIDLDTTPEIDHHRVVAQLQRRIDELKSTLSQTQREEKKAKLQAERSCKEMSLIQKQFYDPVQSNGKASLTSMRRLIHWRRPERTAGFGQFCRKAGNMFGPSILSRQMRGNPLAASDKLSALKSRLSHAVTINCHLVYPVYCLRFDRTGKYFVTGSDDQLVKLFCLGVGPKRKHDGSSIPGFTYGANLRGAALVCTLKGHAGVVSDVDVSADNALVATASGDGDVRIWGLRDGCPIAILRGHTDGANMVSWSSLTPFRLITCGEDGLAKMWDVREAALRRYGDVLGDRCDYVLPKQKLEKVGKTFSHDEAEAKSSDSVKEDEVMEEETQSSPISSRRQPDRRGSETRVTEPVRSPSNVAAEGENQVVVPPLPPGAEGIGLTGALNQETAGGNGVRIGSGEFVASDAIDEGVTLLAQLQHGAITNESQQYGPSTRGRRKSVKVMCITRCPVGGHFATGSDDGLGRVWADEDDQLVESMDDDLREIRQTWKVGMTCLRIKPSPKSRSPGSRMSARLTAAQGPSNAPSKETLLATLPGHNNAITDMKYSSAGDRILTASMKDGVVRIWSWGRESATVIDGNSNQTSTSDFLRDSNATKFLNLSQLMIRLTAASRNQSVGSGSSVSSKRKGSSSSAANAQVVHCDGVSWTCDDQKIVTSQSSPLKASGNEIVPGSHLMYVWDSLTGECLMGILSSHTSLCSTLAAHPFLPSVMATAGSDGVVNVWDLDKGDCFCTHTNSLDHGPVEPTSDRGKKCGYLDGQFSPDGLYLVFTDENGRVTIFDTLVPSYLRLDTNISGSNDSLGSISSYGFRDDSPGYFSTPSWMNEQYFANDYYDLFYDEHGYCVERGTQLPPHLAPKGVRCTHSGISHEEDIRETYLKLEGPLPLKEDDVRWERDRIRARSVEVRKDGGVLSGSTKKKTVLLVESPGLLDGCTKTAFISPDGKLLQPGKTELPAQDRRRNSEGSTRNTATTTFTERPLSARYRWRGYEDIQDDDEAREDEDDEDYEENAISGARRLVARNVRDNDHDLSGVESDEESGASNASHVPERQRSTVRSRARSDTHTGGRQRNRRVDRSVSFEDQTQQQPARSSSRRATKQVYDVPDSDDDEFDELMSTHTTPSGNFSDDWTNAGHIFKMPRGSEIHRKWLTRTSYPGARAGKSMYCPQVGDFVVYIARAHYDTIQKYPTGGCTAPWKSWPANFSWPVVRCKVTHIRYRFPYEIYFNSRNEKLQGVAAILTLEITGIPPNSSDSRRFPWPDPNFVSPRTRSHDFKFEVTLFECDTEEFIIPEYLYTWRIEELEKAIEKRGGTPDGIAVVVHFQPSVDQYETVVEDAAFEEYQCILSHFSGDESDEFHFSNSGYNAITMCWADEKDGNLDEGFQCCTWNVIVAHAVNGVPLAPTMDENITKAVTRALDRVMDADHRIKMWFFSPVDTRKYTDYLNMIEVPMCLSTIQTRLKNKYYTNKESVISDVNLIKENCYKYNEANNELYAVSCEMYEHFKLLVDAISSPEQKSSPAKAKGSNTRNKGVDSPGTASAESDHSSPVSGRKIRLTLRATRPIGHGRNRPTSLESLQNPESDSSENTTPRVAPDEKEENVQPVRTTRRTRRRPPQHFDLYELNSNDEHQSDSDSVSNTDEDDSSQSDNSEDTADKNTTDSNEDSDEESFIEDTPEKKSRQKKPAPTATRRCTRIAQKKATNNIRRSSRTHKAMASTRAGRRQTRTGADSSDVDGNINGSSSSDTEPPPTRKRRRPAPPNKKKAPIKKQKKTGGYLYYPDLPKWPVIPSKKIPNVGEFIISRLRDLDTDGLFTIPVAEEYPDVADHYLAIVKQPMDFRTIEEDRIPYYRHISEMQNDLILTFRNCCVFNGEQSPHYERAVSLWRNLNDIFEEACKENRIALSRFSK